MPSSRTNLKQLKARMDVLDQENRMLSEQSEEILLISLISEVTNHIDEKYALLENILERISILKNIPWCSCYIIENNKVKHECSYASFTDEEKPENFLQIKSTLLSKINSEPLFIKRNRSEINGLSFTNSHFQPKSFLIFPYKSLSSPTGFFLFADDDPNTDKLENMQHLFQQVINMTIAALDKIFLLQQLKTFNADLEIRVNQRTNDLKKSNERLKTEIRERIEAEKALKENEAKYSDLFENANDAIFLLDINYNYIDVNKKGIDLFGYSKAEILKMNLFDVIPKEQKDISETELQKLKNVGGYENFNGKIITKNGLIKYVEVNSSAIIENGRIIGSRDIVRDVTERNRTEEIVLNIAKGVSASTGDMFFNSMVIHLCNMLDVDYAFIGELMDDSDRIKTISASLDGKIIRNFEYDLLDTPCATVFELGTCVYPTGVYKLFSKDRFLVTKKIEGYIGTILRDSRNKDLGILLILSKKPIQKPDFIKSILQIFAVRVSAELERTKSEKILRLSEIKFKHLFEEIPDAIFITQIGGKDAGKILDVNSAAVKQTGYSKNELIGMNIIHDLSEDFMEIREKERLENKLLDGSTVKFVERKKRKDGSEYWVEVLITPMMHDQKKVSISVNRDITVQKQAEEKIRKLSRSVEQSNASVVITDLKGNIEYVNPKFVSVSGYSLEEVKGKNPRILKASGTTKEEYKNLWETITSGREWRGEFQNMKKNGELFWEFASISPIKNEKNEVTHFVAVKEDITKKKQLQQQLNQAIKMESIGTLAGGIAHDFNNLLTIINGHTELALMKAEKDDSIYQDLNAILQAGKRAENLTSHLLAFSRKQVYKPIILDVYKLISNFDKILQRLIGEDIVINISLVTKNPKIKADPGQIEQIIMNLVINARDAINEHQNRKQKKLVTIEIGHLEINEGFASDHLGTKPGKYVYFSISDNGIGMDEETKSKIFDPFFTTKGKGKGTGLGLSMVYGIVKQNKGNIYVYSEPGNGTKFKIYWPASVEETTQKSKHIKTTSLKGNENILLVEDDHEVRNFTLTALRNLGYNVMEASNGIDALAKVKKSKIKFDLLITDLIMPEMSGKELSGIFKKKYPETKILFTSGYVENQFTEKELSSKNFNFISKPYSVQFFAQKIKEVLKQPKTEK